MGILTAVTAAASTVTSYVGQEQTAKATQDAAIKAYATEQHQLTLREMQEQDAASQKTSIQNIEDAQKSAEVAVSAASGGVGGVSVDNLIADVHRQAARNRNTIFENTQMTVAQLQQEKKGAQATAQSRINSAPRPSPLSLVAGLGGDALSGYNAYNKYVS
jgi:hypothetical protein